MKKILPLLVIILTGIWFFISGSPSPNVPEQAQGSGDIGKAFSLINQEGNPVNDQDFRGKMMLVFFGFTSCPDMCPTTLLLMSQALELLKGDAHKIAPIFITVDPEHDTPAELKNFLAKFSPAIVGLTGTVQQIEEVEQGYKVYAQKTNKNEQGVQNFDHSGYLYLMDGSGRFVTAFSPDTSAQTMAEKIHESLSNNL